MAKPDRHGLNQLLGLELSIEPLALPFLLTWSPV